MRRMTFGMFLIVVAVAVTGAAQDQPAQKSLSATMNVYVSPTAGQDAAQQSKNDIGIGAWLEEAGKLDVDRISS